MFLQIVTMVECGSDNSISCGNYFITNQFFTIKENISANIYNLMPGYNRILLDEPINAVSGTLVIIRNSKLLPLAIYESENSNFGDYMISANDSLIEINAYYKYRFFSTV